MDDYEQSLEHLKMALQYESQLEQGPTQINNSVGTIVNIVTILSKTNQHRQAMEFAKQAISKMNISYSQDGVLCFGGQPASENLTATAVIAYFNAGVESEFLGLWSEGSKYYDTALQMIQEGSE